MHRLNFVQKKLRSITKRTLLNLINYSDSYIVQHIPEFIGRKNISFTELRNMWSHDNPQNKADLTRLLFFLATLEELLESPIPGAFAELGVYKGNSAKILHYLAPERKFYLLDTFKGFDAKDVSSDPKQKIHNRHFLDTSLEKVEKWIAGNDQVVFCPGHFPETACMIPSEETFSLVHLDADLYEPTLSGLQFFYPRTNPGGFIIIHDYFSGAWPGVQKAVDEFFKEKAEFPIRIPDKSGTVVFRKVAS